MPARGNSSSKSVTELKPPAKPRTSRSTRAKSTSFQALTRTTVSEWPDTLRAEMAVAYARVADDAIAGSDPQLLVQVLAKLDMLVARRGGDPVVIEDDDDGFPAAGGGRKSVLAEFVGSGPEVRD